MTGISEPRLATAFESSRALFNHLSIRMRRAGAKQRMKRGDMQPEEFQNEVQSRIAGRQAFDLNKSHGRAIAAQEARSFVAEWKAEQSRPGDIARTI